MDPFEQAISQLSAACKQLDIEAKVNILGIKEGKKIKRDLSGLKLTVMSNEKVSECPNESQESSEKPFLIYVAGPYSGDNNHVIDSNIAAAEHVAKLLSKRGYMPVTPHKNTAQFERVVPSQKPEFWIDGTLALLEKCDAVVLVPGWQESIGTLGEIRHALKLGIPVHGDPMQLPLTQWNTYQGEDPMDQLPETISQALNR